MQVAVYTCKHRYLRQVQDKCPLSLPCYGIQVGAYARKHRYLQQEHDEAQQRLQLVERLLKQFDCSSSQELLTAVAEAEADLDMWYQMEGETATTCESHCANHYLYESEGLLDMSC